MTGYKKVILGSSGPSGTFHQSFTANTKKQKNICTHKLTDNSLHDLTCLWTGVGHWRTRREPMQAQREHCEDFTNSKDDCKSITSKMF